MEEQETNTVTVSSAEVEYRVMAATSKKLTWLNNFLSKLRLGDF